MKSRAISVSLFIVASVIQMVLLDMDASDKMLLPYADLFFRCPEPQGMIYITFFSFIPVPFMLLCVSEEAESEKKGYSTLKIIRSYSRSLLIMRKIVYRAAAVFILVVYMSVLSVFAEGRADMAESAVYARTFFAYWLTFTDIALIELFLDLYTEQHQAINAGINGYVVISLFTANVLSARPFDAVFFPRLAYANINGAAEGMGGYYYANAAFLLVLGIIVTASCLHRYMRKDII